MLAFLMAGGAWDEGPFGAEDLERARAELRALGATFVAVSSDRLWSFRPDEETRHLGGASTLEPRQVAQLREVFGVPPGADAVFVLDEDLASSFEQIIPHDERVDVDATIAAILDALTMAGRAVLPRRSDALLPTRRQFVVSSLVAAFSLAFIGGCRTHVAARSSADVAPDAEVDLTLEINGVARRMRLEPRVTLLDALRERLSLSGTKKGCDQGQCGACTVLVGGRRVNACLTLAVMADGLPITTIEGLARPEGLHPLQAAFIAEDGFQCGYCTPGQLMSAAGLLAEHEGERHELTDDAVREGMSGNLCRCGAYPNIVAAIQRARKEP